MTIIYYLRQQLRLFTNLPNLARTSELKSNSTIYVKARSCANSFTVPTENLAK